MVMDSLKSCPFCGGRAKIMTFEERTIHYDCDIIYNQDGWFEIGIEPGETIDQDCYIECAECGMVTPLHDGSESAINAWNTRHC